MTNMSYDYIRNVINQALPTDAPKMDGCGNRGLVSDQADTLLHHVVDGLLDNEVVNGPGTYEGWDVAVAIDLYGTHCETNDLSKADLVAVHDAVRKVLAYLVAEAKAEVAA